MPTSSWENYFCSVLGNMKWFALYLIGIYSNICYAGISNEISLKVDVSEVQHCPDRGLDKLQFYLERSEADQNAPQFSGNITVPIDLDEEVKFHINFAKYEDGAYEDKFYEMTIVGCNDFMEITDNWLIKAFETDGNDYACPITKNIYTIQDFVFDLTPDPEKMKMGYYKVFIDVIDNEGNKQGCITAIVVITDI